jgi:hypothetical protein
MNRRATVAFLRPHLQNGLTTMRAFLQTRALALLLPALALITEASFPRVVSKQVPLQNDRAIADDKGEQCCMLVTIGR